MAAEVVFAPVAMRDLDAILARIALESPPAARRLVDSLLSRCIKLRTLPECRTPVRRNLRRLGAGKYLISYRLSAGRGSFSHLVEAVRVIHGAQNLPASLR